MAFTRLEPKNKIASGEFKLSTASYRNGPWRLKGARGKRQAGAVIP